MTSSDVEEERRIYSDIVEFTADPKMGFVKLWDKNWQTYTITEEHPTISTVVIQNADFKEFVWGPVKMINGHINNIEYNILKPAINSRLSIKFSLPVECNIYTVHREIGRFILTLLSGTEYIDVLVCYGYR